MRKSIKNALEQLHALGCKLDHADRELRTDRWRFTHPNAPDEVFTINYRSSETGVRTVLQRAKIAAGLATSETVASKPKISNRERLEREAERRRRDASRAAAAARAAEREVRELAARRRRQVDEMDRLMRGRTAGGTALADGMLTVEQVADQTGLADRVVRRVIDRGAIEAYQCGEHVKVKSSDVKAWLTSFRNEAS